MNWVRSRVRQGAVLALMALAIQLVLSFGHFHSDGLAHAAPLTATGAQLDAPPPAGPNPHPDGLAADGCAICATIALAGTLVAATPPALQLPSAFAVTVAAAPPDAVLPKPTRAAFRSRAPPPFLTPIV